MVLSGILYLKEPFVIAFLIHHVSVIMEDVMDMVLRVTAHVKVLGMFELV